MAEAAVRAKPVAEVPKEPETDPNTIVVKLQKPVQAHGEPVKELVFRRPTGGDLMALPDWPIMIDYNTGRISPNPAMMGQMMGVLAGVPPSTIKQIEAQDWSTCAHRLMGFFVPQG
jgi:Phage tail assembly chaperone proteins, E, or 41 or 14